MTKSFLKMHGLGNDFAVFEQQAGERAFTYEQIRDLADRKTGIGFDQMIVLSGANDADIFMKIYNADGGEVGACGNASRCVGELLMTRTGKDSIVIKTETGLVKASRAGAGQVCVDMGQPRFAWAGIPLAQEMDTLSLDYEKNGLSQPCAVNMGNPHAVFFVEDVAAVDLETIGPVIETDSLFPERINVEVVQVLSKNRLRMRVWERGAGITRSCGTGACAAAVAANRRGLTGRKVSVVLDGGELDIDWNEKDDHVLMTGAVVTVYKGELI